MRHLSIEVLATVHICSIAQSPRRVQCKIYFLFAYTCVDLILSNCGPELRSQLTQPSPKIIFYFLTIESILEFFSSARIRNLLNNRKYV